MCSGMVMVCKEVIHLLRLLSPAMMAQWQYCIDDGSIPPAYLIRPAGVKTSRMAYVNPLLLNPYPAGG